MDDAWQAHWEVLGTVNATLVQPRVLSGVVPLLAVRKAWRAGLICPFGGDEEAEADWRYWRWTLTDAGRAAVAGAGRKHKGPTPAQEPAPQ